MDAKKFVETLPQAVIDQILSNSNAPVLETESDLIDAIETSPEDFSEVIREYAPEWADEMGL